MAMQADVILHNGMELKNAYIVIDILKSKLQFNGCRINVFIFVNEEMKINNIPVAFGTVFVEQSSQDFIDYFDEEMLKQKGLTDTGQAYEYIKIKDGKLEEVLGFRIGWLNIKNIGQ